MRKHSWWAGEAWAANDYIPCRWRGTVYMRDGGSRQKQRKRDGSRTKSPAALKPKFSSFSASQDLHLLAKMWELSTRLPSDGAALESLQLKVLSNLLSIGGWRAYWCKQQEEEEENPLLKQMWALWVHLILEGVRTSGCPEVSQADHGVLWSLSTQGVMISPKGNNMLITPLAGEFRLRLFSFKLSI